MPISVNEDRIRQDVCQICQLMYDRGLIGGPSGNVSARLAPDRILLTPSIPFKQFLKPEQLIVVNMEGKKVGPETEANRHLRPTSELPMHLDAYRLRPDVGGIVHAHPTYCVALTVAGLPLRTQVLTEGMLFLGAVPTADYATPTTVELSQSVARLIPGHDAVLLPYHGALTVGKDVWNAYAKLEVLEQVAHIECTVHQLGGERPLPLPEVKKMLELRCKMGHEMPGDHLLLDK